MKVAIVLFGLLACALAMPAPQELPAGVSPAECINYPFCGAGPGQDQVRYNFWSFTKLLFRFDYE